MGDIQKKPKLVGDFIRKRRETLGLSQRALGLLFSPPVTTQFISNIERGVTPLPPAHVPTLTKALQVSEIEMLGLMEKEYTFKLSGKISGSFDAAIAARSIAGAVPVENKDVDFMSALYEAYRRADESTKQAFASACENLLKMPFKAIEEVAQQAAASTLAAAAGGVSSSEAQ